MTPRTLLLTLLPPLVVGLGTIGVFSRLGEQGALDAETSAVAPLDGVEVLVLGNSVGAAAIDPTALQRQTRLTTVSLAETGTQPAHWLAALRHQVRFDGHQPREVVIYAPLHLLLHGALVDPKEQALLLSMLTRPDGPLLDDALSTARVSPVDRLRRGRVRLRTGLLSSLSVGPLRAVLGSESVDAALAAQPTVALQQGSRPTTVPGDRRRGTPAHVEPQSRPYEQSFLPEILEEARRLEARLWFVAPAVRPSDRPTPPCVHSPGDQALLDLLIDDGAQFLDLTWAPVPEADFRSLFHPGAAGREAITHRLSGALLGEATEPAPGCASGTGP